MTKGFVLLIVSLFLSAGLLVSPTAKADVFLITDFDGTWSGDDYAEKGKEGSWSTYYRLFRINSTSHPAAILPINTPDEVLVSHKDYDRIRMYLASGEGVSGSLVPFPMRDAILPSGKPVTELTPGLFKVVDPVSYSRFRGMRRDHSGDQHVNYLLEDYLKAMSVAKENSRKFSHKGLGESVVAHFLSDEHLSQNVRVLTARGADDLDWTELFEEMKKMDGYNFVPLTRKDQAAERPKGVVALGHPEYANLLGKSVKEKKVTYLKYLADRLLKAEPLELVLAPNGSTYEYYHTIIFQDDDPEILKAVYEMFKELAERRHHRIKFVLRNTGTPEEVEQTQWYVVDKKGSRGKVNSQVQLKAVRDIVVKEDGTIREASPKEDIFIDPRVAQEAKGLIKRIVKKTSEGKLMPISGRGKRQYVDVVEGGDCEKGF